MFPAHGRVVAGSSGKPQLPSGEGSRPFSGQGGAGGVIAPIDPTDRRCLSSSARWSFSSCLTVGIRIGLALAVTAPTLSMSARAHTSAPNQQLLLIVTLPAGDRCGASAALKNGMPSAAQTSTRNQLHDPLDHLVEAHSGRVALVGAGGGRQRRVPAGLIKLVADGLLGQHRLGIAAEFGRPAAGTLLRRSGE